VTDHKELTIRINTKVIGSIFATAPHKIVTFSKCKPALIKFLIKHMLATEEAMLTIKMGILIYLLNLKRSNDNKAHSKGVHIIILIKLSLL
jgi:hypothetical protein